MASSAFFVHSYWRAQEYINTDDAIIKCGVKPLCNGHLFITAIITELDVV